MSNNVWKTIREPMGLNCTSRVDMASLMITTLKWLLLPIAVGISFYLGICYQDLQQANLAEDIISREISILERYKDQPGCEATRLHNVGAKSLDQGVIVVWDTTRQSKTFLAPDGFVVVGELRHCP